MGETVVHIEALEHRHLTSLKGVKTFCGLSTGQVDEQGEECIYYIDDRRGTASMGRVATCEACILLEFQENAAV